MGRPKTIATQETVTTEETTPTVVVPRTRDEIVQARPERVPLHEQRDKMTTPKKSGFVRRWVNDVGNRVERFIMAGWTIVDDPDLTVGDVGVIDNNVSLGTGARKNVGRTRSSDNTVAVLMEIREDLYAEDQRAKQRTVDASEDVIKRKVREKEFYGEFKQKSGNK